MPPSSSTLSKVVFLCADCWRDLGSANNLAIQAFAPRHCKKCGRMCDPQKEAYAHCWASELPTDWSRRTTKPPPPDGSEGGSAPA